MNQTEFTYGEILFSHFIPLLDLCQPQQGEIFYDLGCGGGKPLIVASIAFPLLKRVVGIELLHFLLR